MRTSFRAFAIATLVLSTVALYGCGGAQARKQGYLERGDKYFAEQNYEKARVEYRNAMQIDPKDAQARYSVGRTSEKLSNPKDAVAQYQAAIDADPKHTAARAALARLFLLGGVPDKALELAEAGLTDAPNSAELLTVRAAVQARKGRIEAAFEDANAAIKINPADEYTVALLASLYSQGGRSDKAIEVVREGLALLPKNVDLHVVLADLELAQGHPGQAEEQLTRVIELEPKSLMHRYRLARFHISQKNLDAAEAVLRDTIKAEPENATAKMALVEFLSAQRDPITAEKQLEEFVARNPKDEQLRLQLGAYYEQREQTEKAEQTYKAVIASSDTKPDGLMARNRLAALFLKRNDIKQATALIDQVLKENARDNDALIMRGNLALARGDTTSAITDLRSVLRDQPNAVSVMRALARAHLQNKELALAEETLHNAVQVNPRDPDTRLDLAQFFTQTGRPEQARPLLEQLADEMPSDVRMYDSIIRVQTLQKDFAAARTSAKKFQELRPDLSLAYYLGGIVEEADGKIDAAIREFEAALKIQPNASDPLVALVRIELTRKQPDRALARVDQAIVANSENAVAHNIRGELFIARGKPSEAVANFEAAIAAEPRWWVPYRGLAIAQAGGNNYDASIAALKRGIDTGNGEPKLFAELATLYERLNRDTDAMATYEAWLGREPNSLIAANNLAMLLVNEGKDKKHLERAQQLSAQLSKSDEPAVLDTRGWIDYKSGNFRQAVQLLERAVEKSATSPVLKYHLAMAQLANGDPLGARRNLEAALSGGAKFDGADEAQSALNELKKTG
jgi:tetratricopeptide (TPR) repeat protein